MQLDLRSGAGRVRLAVPDDRLRRPWRARPTEAETSPERALAELETSGALDHMTSERITLLVVDGTRPEPPEEFLQPLVQRLAGARGLRVLLCTGTHEPDTPANRERAGRWAERLSVRVPGAQVHVHDARRDAIVRHGTTARGTPIELSQALDDADRYLVLSDVKHHYFAGYSNPVKHFLPGMASLEAVRANHAFALESAARAGAHPWHPDPSRRENPVAEDQCDALVPALGGRPAHALVTVGADGPLEWAGGGPLPEVSTRAFEACDRLGAWRAAPARIVVVGTGGEPWDDDLYTAQRALELSREVRAPGARVLWLAACGRGVGPPSSREHFVDRLARPLEEARRVNRVGYALYSHKAVRFANYLADCEVTLASELPEDLVRGIHLSSTDDPAATLAEWTSDDPNADVLVLEGAARKLHLAEA